MNRVSTFKRALLFSNVEVCTVPRIGRRDPKRSRAWNGIADLFCNLVKGVKLIARSIRGRRIGALGRFRFLVYCEFRIHSVNRLLCTMAWGKRVNVRRLRQDRARPLRFRECVEGGDVGFRAEGPKVLIFRGAVERHVPWLLSYASEDMCQGVARLAREARVIGSNRVIVVLVDRRGDVCKAGVRERGLLARVQTAVRRGANFLHLCRRQETRPFIACVLANARQAYASSAKRPHAYSHAWRDSFRFESPVGFASKMVAAPGFFYASMHATSRGFEVSDPITSPLFAGAGT